MIAMQQDQTIAELPVGASPLMETLNRSFLAAHLLTGSSAHAEGAVKAAINLWDPGDDGEKLLELTLKTAAQVAVIVSPARSTDGCVGAFLLPAELRRVLELEPKLRRCFVLRLLVGLSPQGCAQVLRLSVPQIVRYTRNAVIDLAALNCRITSQE